MRNILKALVVAGALAPTAAEAGSDVLVRQIIPSFDACVAVQDNMMRNLGVEPAALSVEVDTGAMLERKYASGAADLVLTCNRVTDVLEVRRITPGTLREDAALDTGPTVVPAPLAEASAQ